MGERAVPEVYLRALAEQARLHGVMLLSVTSAAMRHPLTDVLSDAGRPQRYVPGCPAELRIWSRRYTGAHDGIPAANRLASPVGTTGVPLRPFPYGRLRQPPQPLGHAADDAALLLVIATPGDEPVDRLRAGCWPRPDSAWPPRHSQALEVPAAREAVRCHVLHIPEHPRLLLRVGWRAEGVDDLPATPRRDLSAVLLASPQVDISRCRSGAPSIRRGPARRGLNSRRRAAMIRVADRR